MDYIKYETTLKASGREYSKIVFWNRFIRNPIELILTCFPPRLQLSALHSAAFLLILPSLCSMLVLSHFIFLVSSLKAA